MDAPNRLLAAALEVQQFCERQGWRFCFIGGIAVQHWGQARLTRDADLTVFTGIGDEARYVDALLARFASRMADAHAFAMRQRVLLLRSASGIPLDVSLGALQFEEHAVATSTLEEIAPGVRLRLCTASALVVFKAFAGRPQDWLDIEGISLKSKRLLDWDQIRHDLGILLDLKGDTESMQRLAAIASRRT